MANEAFALRDVRNPREVESSELVYNGMVWNVRRDRVNLDDAGVVHRDYVEHTGAVVVIALNERSEVMVLQQYRHPVGLDMVEVPAGLLDIAGEPPHIGAARELAEEADLQAATWNVLLDICSSPGGNSEAIRIFLARDITQAPDTGYVREHEEALMKTQWAPLDDLVSAIMRNEVHNTPLIVGILATLNAVNTGFQHLQPADAPFDIHPAYRD